MERKQRILICEDDLKYTRLLSIIMKSNGFETLIAYDGPSAITVAAEKNPNLIILDIKLPGIDGFETLRQIREFSTVPVIMVTAMAEERDKVKGLLSGADDYITKPFSAEELLARVQAALRRIEYDRAPHSNAVFQTGDLKIDFSAQRVFLLGQEVHLSAIEYKLLCEFASNAGRVLNSEYLLEAVWGERYIGEDRLVWREIHRLRQKLEKDPTAARYIHTRPGCGYILYTAPSDLDVPEE